MKQLNMTGIGMTPSCLCGMLGFICKHLNLFSISIRYLSVLTILNRIWSLLIILINVFFFVRCFVRNENYRRFLIWHFPLTWREHIMLNLFSRLLVGKSVLYISYSHLNPTCLFISLPFAPSRNIATKSGLMFLWCV